MNVECATSNFEDNSRSIRSRFNLTEVGADSPHSMHIADLSFERKHDFQGYGKNKTIDQFVSKEGDTYYRITSEKEIQFITSQVVGSAINASPIYIDEQDNYYSKKVSFPTNMLEAVIGVFLLNVIADDWDHEVPYADEVMVRNYECGAFFDFSHSKIALESTQANLSRQMILQKTQGGLERTREKISHIHGSKGNRFAD